MGCGPWGAFRSVHSLLLFKGLMGLTVAARVLPVNVVLAASIVAIRVVVASVIIVTLIMQLL